MTQNEAQGVAPRVREPVLVIDTSTAHMVVDPQQTEALLAWFRRKGIGCEVRRPGWPGGPDLIDFGNPSPAEERRIRAAFAEWQKTSSPPGGHMRRK